MPVSWEPCIQSENLFYACLLGGRCPTTLLSDPSPRIDPGGNSFLWDPGPSRDPKMHVHTHQVWGQLQLHFSKLLCPSVGSGPGTFAPLRVHPDPGCPKIASKNPLPHPIVTRSEFCANPIGGSGVIEEQSR